MSHSIRQARLGARRVSLQAGIFTLRVQSWPATGIRIIRTPPVFTSRFETPLTFLSKPAISPADHILAITNLGAYTTAVSSQIPQGIKATVTISFMRWQVRPYSTQQLVQPVGWM